MSVLPQPKPAQLGQPGLYALPRAEGFAGIVLAGGRLPIQPHFSLMDGTEFHLPISDIARERLYTALAGLQGLQAGEMPPRQLLDHRISDDPTVESHGRDATIEATTENGTALRLTMPRHALEALRSSIDDALSQ
jgi:hypothetical protein